MTTIEWELFCHQNAPNPYRTWARKLVHENAMGQLVASLPKVKPIELLQSRVFGEPVWLTPNEKRVLDWYTADEKERIPWEQFRAEMLESLNDPD